jgi:metallo-beta-lactamase class B
MSKKRGLRIYVGLVSTLVLTTAAWTGTSASVAADSEDISVSWLTGRIYLVEDSHFAATNSLVYIGESSVTVIGATWTPDTAKQLAAHIRSLTALPIREVIDTSPDPEWSGGNAYWKDAGAEVIAAQATCDGLSRTWNRTVADIRASYPGYPDLPLVAPTRCLANHFELQNGDVRAFYLGPSHTAADIFVYFPKERVLDAGSILKPFLGNMAKANVEEYPKTLHKLQDLRLDIRMIISGHWSAVHGPDLIDRYLDLLARSRTLPK